MFAIFLGQGFPTEKYSIFMFAESLFIRNGHKAGCVFQGTAMSVLKMVSVTDH